MRLPLLLLTVACLTLGALATAAPAGAFQCATTLTDSAGFAWGLDDTGAVITGGKDASADPYGSSVIDGYPSLNLVRAGEDPLDDGVSYISTDPDGCILGQGGREMLFPAHSLGGSMPELVASRRVYVPAAGRAFARWIDTIRNTSNVTQQYDVLLFGGLGSDCGTKIADDSTGDGFLSRRDRWMITYDDVAGSDTCPDVQSIPNPDSSTGLPLAHNWDGPSSPPDRADEFPAYRGFTLTPGGFLSIQYDDVTLEPGKSASYVTFETQSTTVPNDTLSASIAANGIDAVPPELFTGMSAADRARVRNWCIGDCDKDGVADTHDNCKGVANPAQVNSDKDADGNACDPDDDNDGRSDAAEIALGTNPLSPKDAPPTLTKMAAPKTAKAGKSVTITATAGDDYGVRRVTFYSKNRLLCVDSSAPYQCTWRFGATGDRPVTAIASDAVGQVAARTRTIKVTP
jgi:hypothetical protein